MANIIARLMGLPVAPGPIEETFLVVEAPEPGPYDEPFSTAATMAPPPLVISPATQLALDGDLPAKELAI